VLYSDQDSIATAEFNMLVAQLPVSVAERDWVGLDGQPEANHERLWDCDMDER